MFTSIFTEIEESLVQHLIQMNRVGFGLNTKKLRRLVYDYCDANEIAAFPENEERMAGRKWARNFLRRHKKRVKIKKARNYCVGRAQAANKPKLRTWFQRVEREQAETGQYDPRYIWNVDEKPLMDVPKDGTYVIGETGISSKRQTQAEKGQLTTVLAFFNAYGEVMPPCVIHPSKAERVNSGWLKNSKNAHVMATQSGYINREKFYDYGVKFVQYLEGKERLDKPNLLFFDGHKSHVSNWPFRDLMKRNNIRVLCLPPKCTTFIQPADIYIHAALDGAWNNGVAEYNEENCGRRLPKTEFFSKFWEAWDHAMNPHTIRCAWHDSGLYPLNMDAIKEHHFAHSQVSDSKSSWSVVL